MKVYEQIIWVVIALVCVRCQSDPTSTTKISSKESDILLGKTIPESQLIHSIPELAFYAHRLEKALQQVPPVLTLNASELADTQSIISQQVALQDTHFIRDAFHRVTKAPLRTEIMGVRKVMPADITTEKNQCKEGDCYRVELYNYFYNSTSVAIVNWKNKEVISVDHQPGHQASINAHLQKIAISIALNSPEVIMALGINPSEKDVLMSNVTTALNGTKCERSRHLCVAPTFVVGDKALWTIVDLTDWKLVGLRWTDVGKPNASKMITERNMQDEYIMQHFCDRENEIKREDWQITHRLTSSDGLEIVNVKYKGRKVIESAKIVDCHVSYSFKEGFGYNDAMGCPMFSSAAVVAFNAPFEEDIMKNGRKIGFALMQDFRSAVWPEPCNYRYQNRFEFYSDGSFRIEGIQLGRGCGITGTYRPVFRMHIAPDSSTSYNFEQWTATGWTKWNREQWHLQEQNTAYSPEGYLFRLVDNKGHGYYIEPNRGQFGDDSRGDHAYTYVTKFHSDRDEGQKNMVSFGSCCATDYQQGPEQFMDPAESIEQGDMVIWYVPQMENDNREGSKYCWAEIRTEKGRSVAKVWPGTVGPQFIPF